MKTNFADINYKQDSGYVAFFLIVFFVASVALLGTTSRALLGLTSVSKQSQSRSARNAAEAGISQVIDSLNSTYAHLLVVDSDKWENPPLFSGICSNSAAGVPLTSGSVAENTRFELVNYDFRGSPFYGGKADISMKGEVLRGGKSLATAIINQTVEIKAKSCTNSFEEPTTTSGFPGLLAQSVDMGGNDLKGRLSGNLFCLDCTSSIPTKCNISGSKSLDEYTLTEEICVIGGNSNQTDIDGEIFLSPIDLPPVPIPPTSMNDLYDNPPSITTSISIVGGSTDSNELLNGACRIDNSGTTHCVVDNIDLSGSNTLTINTTKGPVRIYVSGQTVDFKGQSGMEHIPIDSPSVNLGLFGRAIDPTNSISDQEVILRGRATTNNMWAYFPDGHLGIKGGAADDVQCDELGQCTGGDIYGAVWGKKWGLSNGTGAQINVPDDMGQQLFNTFGPAYGIGMKDYIAIGVSKWSSFTMAEP